VNLSPEQHAELIGKVQHFLLDGISASEITTGLSEHLQIKHNVLDYADVANDILKTTIARETVRRLREDSSEKNVRETKSWLQLQGKMPQEARDLIEKALAEIQPTSVPVAEPIAESVVAEQTQVINPALKTPLTFFESIALPLAVERGWKVAPCYPRDKTVHTKLVPDPLNMISNDPAQIHAWGFAEPNANVCVYAEQVEGGLLFLDKDGAISLREKYERETGKTFPKTLLVRSSVVDGGNGGTISKGHWYFLQTPRTLALKGNIPESKTGGLFSLRVHHQYVATIGSVHPKTGKPYEIAEDFPVAPISDDLLDWLLTQIVEEKAAPVTATGERVLIPHGQLHGAYIAEAGRLWQRGYSAEDVVEMTIKWTHENGQPPINDSKVRKEALDVIARYPRGTNTDLALTQPAQTAAETPAIPIVDDPSDNDSRFEMTGETFNTKVYEDISRRFTPYPDPGEGDLVSRLSKKLVTGTPIPLAYVREPLKAIVLHAIDGKVIHPAHRKLTMRGNYFSLGESESNKTTGLEYALNAGNLILTTSGIHPQDLFRYKSEQTFIRSFTPEGTIKRDAQGNIKSGRAGNPSQFLYIKEGNLVANCSDYFGAVFSRLTDLYDQTQASTESMTNGDFEAGTVKASTVMCFTPTDHAGTFSGKGTIGGGGLNRWGLVNPPEDHSYDDKDWEPLSDTEIQEAINPLIHKVFELHQGNPIVLVEEAGAAKIRLETKAMLKKAGRAGKRLLEYFMREQVAQAAVAVDGRLVMTTEQARYAKQWVEAQVECRLNCWPSDANNQIEAMEHAIRKAVNRHFVSEKVLKDVCHLYREGSGGWFAFNAARNNMVQSEAIKPTGKTRKGTRAYCPGSCTIHPTNKEDEKSKKT
jgi:hypothetical protein